MTTTTTTNSNKTTIDPRTIVDATFRSARWIQIQEFPLVEEGDSILVMGRVEEYDGAKQTLMLVNPDHGANRIIVMTNALGAMQYWGGLDVLVQFVGEKIKRSVIPPTSSAAPSSSSWGPHEFVLKARLALKMEEGSYEIFKLECEARQGNME